ncbi:hypothetical protein LCGC14_1418580 [marine sediment metagenome]|uniref:ClpX-type ZB domain-containing protein n=1 Tax=marine sediment metagenome TaxID=412755 RepID=A0A0F9JSF7_9ZZZZ
MKCNQCGKETDDIRPQEEGVGICIECAFQNESHEKQGETA